MRTRRRIEAFIHNDLFDGVDPDGDPLAIGMLDSLAVEQLIGFIEDEFQVTFEDEELTVASFSSIDSVVRLVETKRRSARQR
jgi:acyl carrier protein